MLASGHDAARAPGRGYAMLRGQRAPRCSRPATTAGPDLLRAVLARIADAAQADVNVHHRRQQWAIEVCIEARLELRPDERLRVHRR